MRNETNTPTYSSLHPISVLRDEIETSQNEYSELTRRVGEFVRENDHDMPTMHWPDWALEANRRIKELSDDLNDLEAQLKREEEKESIRAEERALAAQNAAIRADREEAERKHQERLARRTPEWLRTQIARIERHMDSISAGPAKNAARSERDRMRNELAAAR